MIISLKLLDSNSAIQSKIVNALLKDCRKFMSNSMVYIKSQMPNVIYNNIINSPEYMSIVGGKLRLELGIPDGQSKIDGLLNIWISNIVYEYSPPTIISNKIKSQIKIYGIKSDFSDVLGSAHSYVVDNERGYSLPWLEWLLLDGTKTIVSDYDVLFGPNSRSRTGFAVMTPSSTGWKVSEYNGTRGDNWITRAIDRAGPEIEKILEGALK
jgi:hypothetical protein